MNALQNNQIVTLESHQQGIARHTRHTYPAPNLTIADIAPTDPSYEEDEIDIKDILRVLLRHKYLIFFITVTSILLAYFISSSMTPTYRAASSIKIDTESNKLAHFDGIFAEKEVNSRTFHQTQFDLLKSRLLARRVIDKLDLEERFKQQAKQTAKPFYSPVIAQAKTLMSGLIPASSPSISTEKQATRTLGEQPIEMKLINNLTIAPSKHSNVVEILYESTDPQLAAIILNTLIDQYLKMNLDGMSKSSTNAKQYLTEQLALAKSKLEASESRVIEYAREEKIIKTDIQGSLISSALDVLSNAHLEAQHELIAAESEFHQRKGEDIRTLDNAVILSLKNRNTELHSQYTQKLQVYKPTFPAMIELKKQIIENQRQLKIELINITKTSQSDLRSRFQVARQKEAQLSKKLELKKTELLARRDKSVQYSNLQREAETNRQLYDNLLQRMKEVGIASGVVSNNVSVIDSALVPYTKFKPNTKRNVMIGALLGLMLGSMLAFLREHLDDRIKTVEDLEKLSNFPVLGTFPFIKNKSNDKNNAALILSEQDSIEAEAFRSLINNLGYIDSDGLPKVLHITSTAPSEGKSSTAINTSIIMAEGNKKVLLIDADLRKPKIHTYLNIPQSSGLTDYLVAKQEIADIITATEHKGFSFISSGARAPNPSQLLSSDRMVELLEYAVKEYDHIVIDSPPVVGLADALILANRSNATLFVVASEQTRKGHFEDALKRLHLGYANIAGFVLTKAKSTKNDYYSYENYYGYKEVEPMKLVYKQ